MPHKHKFDHVAETNQADHYWCEDCGAYKRVPNGNYDDDTKTVISLPRHKCPTTYAPKKSYLK